MSDNAITAIGAFLASIVGLAALAVVLGKSSQTVGVLGAAGSSLSAIINAAVSPVTGNSTASSSNPLSALSGSSNPLSALGSGNPLSFLNG